MSVRLAFSVAVEVDADVLLIDEVLAVGDAAFQQKCFEQFERSSARARRSCSSRTTCRPSSASATARCCSSAASIARASASRTRSRSPTTSSTSAASSSAETPTAEAATATRRAAEIKAAWFEDAAGERITALAQGEPLHDRAWRSASTTPLEDPIFAFHLRNEPRHTVFATSSRLARGAESGSFAAGETARVRVRFENWLAPSRYTVTPSVARAGRARTRSTCARTSRRWWCTARA